MGLTNVINMANSGLWVTQSGLDVVARNIANADSPGYTKKYHNQEGVISGYRHLGVQDLGVTRAVDSYLQMRLRSESAASAHVNIRHQFLQRLDQMFGTPGEPNALDGIVNAFAQSLQQLTTSPDAFESRQAAVTDAQVLAQTLRNLSGEVQGLRQLAEDSLADAVTEVNDALGRLADLNREFLSVSGPHPPADLLDTRDRYLDRLAELLDVRVAESNDGRVRVYTPSGNLLLDGTAVTLEFDRRGSLDAHALYDSDPDKRGVGTIALVADNGYRIDLIQNGVLTAGRIGALIQLRDDILVEAQAQLDELAHGLALAFSSKDVTGTAVTQGAQSGQEIDLTGIQPGNAITLRYEENGTSKTLTIIRVDDTSQLPLSDDVTPDPNDRVLGVDFSSGMANVVSAIQAELGSGFSVSNPSGNVLRILDDGAGNTTDVASLTAVITATSVQDDGLQLPLFTDGSGPDNAYSASLDGGPQKLGFAERITVNAHVVADNELLVRHTTSPLTPIGDPARPLELLDRLTERRLAFSPQSGIGNVKGPYEGPVADFARQVVSYQTGHADRVAREQASQEAVTNVLREKFQADTGVDIDKELADLITLQNAFAANARLIQTVSELMKLIIEIP